MTISNVTQTLYLKAGGPQPQCFFHPISYRKVPEKLCLRRDTWLSVEMDNIVNSLWRCMVSSCICLYLLYYKKNFTVHAHTECCSLIILMPNSWERQEYYSVKTSFVDFKSSKCIYRATKLYVELNTSLLAWFFLLFLISLIPNFECKNITKNVHKCNNILYNCQFAIRTVNVMNGIKGPRGFVWVCVCVQTSPVQFLMQIPLHNKPTTTVPYSAPWSNTSCSSWQANLLMVYCCTNLIHKSDQFVLYKYFHYYLFLYLVATQSNSIIHYHVHQFRNVYEWIIRLK